MVGPNLLSEEKAMFNSGLLKAAGKTVNVDDKKNHKYIRTYMIVFTA